MKTWCLFRKLPFSLLKSYVSLFYTEWSCWCGFPRLFRKMAMWGFDNLVELCIINYPFGEPLLKETSKWMIWGYPHVRKPPYRPLIWLVDTGFGHCFNYCQLEVSYWKYEQPNYFIFSLPETTPFKVGGLLYITPATMSTIRGHLGMWNPASSSPWSISWASSSSSARNNSVTGCNRCLAFFQGIHGNYGVQCIHGKMQ